MRDGPSPDDDDESPPSLDTAIQRLAETIKEFDVHSGVSNGNGHGTMVCNGNGHADATKRNGVFGASSNGNGIGRINNGSRHNSIASGNGSRHNSVTSGNGSRHSSIASGNGSGKANGNGHSMSGNGKGNCKPQLTHETKMEGTKSKEPSLINGKIPGPGK